MWCGTIFFVTVDKVEAGCTLYIALYQTCRQIYVLWMLETSVKINSFPLPLTLPRETLQNEFITKKLGTVQGILLYTFRFGKVIGRRTLEEKKALKDSFHHILV